MRMKPVTRFGGGSAGTSHGISPDRDYDGTWNQGGATEHEAIVALAIWQGWKLWNEE